MAQENHPLNVRGKGGYVVDLDKPYEDVLCFGMGKFLEPVPEAQQDAARQRLDDPTRWPRPIIGFLSEKGLLKRTPPRRRTMEAKLRGNAEAVPPPAPELIPDLDEAPAKGRRKPKAPSQGTIEGADL